MSRIVATYLVKITLRQRDDLLPPDKAAAGTFNSESEPPTPTNVELERLVSDALYDSLQYFTDETIGVSSERTDI